jgi:hypothetical protein
MTRYLHRVIAMSPRQRRRQYDSIALSPAWLGIYIASLLSRLGSVIASVTRQHCRQHDSVSTSRRDQVTPATSSSAWLGSIVISIIWYLHRVTAKSPRSPAWPSNIDASMTQYQRHELLDRQHQQYMTLAVSRHIVSSYRYCSPLCLVLGPMQVSRCIAWHLREASTFRRLTFEDFKL